MSVKNKNIIPLIIERDRNHHFWGRITVNDNLIIESAASKQALIDKLKRLALDFEDVKITEFDIAYDLSAFFEEYAFLNISDIAKKSGINQSLMRQYATGIKFPSEERVKQIQEAIRTIGKELAKIKIVKPNIHLEEA
ncbi:MAG: hypothetical protein K2Y12_03245 [Chitinophagaceae bacterium]|nr:hypothetical protein [Chitinophagaceae bacterium]